MSAKSQIVLGLKGTMLPAQLAVAIGRNEALVLQQIHYWLLKSKNIVNRQTWVYNTYESWRDQLPYLSVATIKRTVASLRRQGLIECQQGLGQSKFDRTLWYTINYAKVRQTLSIASDQNDPIERINLIPCSYKQETTQETTLPPQAAKAFPMTEKRVKRPLKPPMKGTNQKSAEDVVAEYQAPPEAPTPPAKESPSAIFQYFRKLCVYHHPGIMATPAPTVQALSQMKSAYLKSELTFQDFLAMLEWTVANWLDFTTRAKTEEGAFNAPALPQVGFLLKFLGSAMNGYLSAALEPEKGLQEPSAPTPAVKPATIPTYEEEPPATLEDIEGILNG